jgi:hypothetical protein
LILLQAAGSANSSTLSNVEPGLLGFLVVAALGVALVLLLRSMNKQFRKIGPPPEEDAADTAVATADEARDGETGAGAAQDRSAGQNGSPGQDAPQKPAGRDAGTTAP